MWPVLSVSAGPLVPNLGVNYPDWVMGPFDLGNGLGFFSFRVFTKTFH